VVLFKASRDVQLRRVAEAVLADEPDQAAAGEANAR